MLLDFLRACERGEADLPACPGCGYSLKALTRPVCPECGQGLALTVGTLRPRIGWLLIALAPGFFSGIAAVFVLVPIVARLFLGDGKMSPGLNVLDLFGWCSGIFAIILAFRGRHRFLALTSARQRSWALTLWFIHIAALVSFILFARAFL